MPLEALDLYHLNMPGGIGWFVKSRLLKVRSYGASNFKLMNGILPVVRFVERRLRPPFGLSLVMVLKKT